MLKRTIAKYDKNPPHNMISEVELNYPIEDLRNLFDVEDDYDMIFVYEIKTKEQLDFFKQKGVELDRSTGFYFLECQEN